MILEDLIDLAVHRFKHGCDLGELGHLWEVGELVGGHCQIGAWSLEDVVAVNAEKLFIKVVLEWYSLRVKLLLGPRKDILVCSALCAVDIPIDASGTVLLGFPFSRGAVNTDVEDCTPTERRERK